MNCKVTKNKNKKTINRLYINDIKKTIKTINKTVVSFV